MATKETWEHIGTPEMDDATLRAIWMIRYAKVTKNPASLKPDNAYYRDGI
jgi:hypothetical protein